jgi:Tfp pilus assembly protein PilO
VRRPPVIGLLVALVLALAFYFLLYKPASEEQARIEAETATLEQREQQLTTQIAQLRDIEARQVEINAAKARLEEYIPEGPALPSAIRQFQRAADADPAIPDPTTGVAPTDTGDPATTLANIPITMVVNGGYFRVVDFFRRLEVEMPRAVLVQTVGAVEEPEALFPTLAVTWTGQMFAVMPAAEVAGVGGAPPVGPAPAATPTPTPAPEGGDS